MAWPYLTYCLYYPEVSMVIPKNFIRKHLFIKTANSNLRSAKYAEFSIPVVNRSCSYFYQCLKCFIFPI